MLLVRNLSHFPSDRSIDPIFPFFFHTRCPCSILECLSFSICAFSVAPLRCKLRKKSTRKMSLFWFGSSISFSCIDTQKHTRWLLRTQFIYIHVLSPTHSDQSIFPRRNSEHCCGVRPVDCRMPVKSMYSHISTILLWRNFFQFDVNAVDEWNWCRKGQLYANQKHTICQTFTGKK